MNFFSILLFFVLLVIVYSDSETAVEQTLDFLLTGINRLRLSNDPEAIIAVGNTGSGKSTLVHFILDPSQIESIEPTNDADDYKVVDHLDVSPDSKSSTVSKTIVPELIIDTNKKVYYDCPGFDDTRNSSVEISTVFFIKTVTDNTKKLKIIFVVNAKSVQESYDRNDFDNLMRHGTTLLKKTENYKPSVSLVVAKRAPMTQRGMRLVEVTEEKAIESAGKFIENYREVLLEKPAENQAKINLVDGLLVKTADGKFARIGIFFGPNQVGTFDKIPKQMSSRETILKIIHENTNYTETKSDDFGFSLSERAQKNIRGMSLHVNKNITNTLIALDHIVSCELRTKGDKINSLYGRKKFYDFAKTELTKVGNKSVELTPKILLSRGYEFLTAMNLSIPNDYLKNLATQQYHMNVLSLISEEAVLLPVDDWIKKFASTKSRVEQEKNWNAFVVYFYELLISYSVQRDLSAYDVRNVDDWGKSGSQRGLSLHDNNWNDFLRKHTGFYDLVKPIEMTKMRFDTLNELIKATMQTLLKYNCVGDTLSISGEFIRLSDVDLAKCNHTYKVHIFAFHKFFADKKVKFDSNLTEFAVLAHRWHVVEAVRPKLDLRPQSIDNTTEKNVDGTKDRPAGTDGTPGLAGNSGANFFGYANEIHNGNFFEIDISGGRGGTGQNGSRAYPEIPFYNIQPHQEFDGYFGKQQLFDNAQGYLYSKIDGVDESTFADSLGFLSILKKAACRKEDKSSQRAYVLHPRHCCKADGLAGAGKLI